MICIYDLETYKDAFIACFKDKDTQQIYVFEISNRINQFDKLKDFLQTCSGLIGYNNNGFDYPVLHKILTYSNITSEQIHEIANEIINSKYSSIKSYEVLIPQLDLYTIWNYKNKNRATSLKWLEFAMRMDKIQDLPYEPDEDLNNNQINELILYCKHDVEATYQFYLKSLKHIELRQWYCENEHIDVISASEPSLAKALFYRELANELNKSVWDIKQMQSPRTSFNIKDVIFDYVAFEDQGNQGILQKLNKSRWIDKSNMSASDKKKYSISFQQHYKDCVRDWAEGGLHSFSKPGVYKSDNKYILADVDFSSYYPHLTFKNNIGPAHFPKDVFNKLYEGFYKERKKYPKSDPRNYVLKIILNSSYGLSKDTYSALLDQFWQMQICINGQLTLVMLTEKIFKYCSDCKLVFENTDGAMFKILKSEFHLLEQACKEMEEICKIPLEIQECDKIIIRDVNNYINVINDSNIKYKGCFEIDRDYHKNHSQRIVPLAIKRYFINDIPLSETINNHLNSIYNDLDDFENYGIYDFCLGRKKNHNVERYEYITPKENLKLKDKVIRYYVSNNSNKLFKIYNEDDVKVVNTLFGKVKQERIEAVNKGFNIELFQEYYNSNNYNINYTYYINECNKIIKEIN